MLLGPTRLSQAVLLYVAEPQGSTTVAPLELLTLSSTLRSDGVYLHASVASVASAQGVVTAGHVMPGCTVRIRAEAVLALLPGWAFSRAVDEATGYRELVSQRR